MHITDEQTIPLKDWLVRKLDNISDAESDVLADYVLALVKSEEPDSQLKQKCLENLDEFLKDNTAKFVDDVFTAIGSGSYDPNSVSKNSSQPPQNSRKRSFRDDDTEMRDAAGGSMRGGIRFGRGDRPAKQIRRGGFDQQRGGGGRYGRGGGVNSRHQQQMPLIDPNDPLSTMLAMQAMMSNMPGMPEMPFAMPNPSRKGERCQDYDTKGFCALGASCPYDHGSDRLIVPSASGDSYDPNDALFAHQNGRSHGHGRGRGRGRGDGRGGRGASRGGGGRASFSSPAPNHDQSITSVVVENIPDEKYSDTSVREFFSEFGTIEDVSLQENNRLAIVKYQDYASAKKAYDSPKVIFDNRFVKVYWHKPDRVGRYNNNHGARQHMKPADDDTVMVETAAEPEIDPAEFARKQEEAQKQHEEKMAKIKAAQAQRAELNAKLKAQEEERAALLARLAAKDDKIKSTRTGDGTSGTSTPAGVVKDAEARAKTEALKAKLAALEHDARSMGINPNDESGHQPEFQSSFRGRGGFRARGFQRGGWRGRGAGAAVGRGGAVMRLDNRPRTVNVILPEGREMGSDVDEALKQFLLFSNLMESATIQASPERRDAALVSFTERYKAESFVGAAAKEIPHIGKCELSWAANSSITPTSATFASDDVGGPEDVNMENGHKADVDYDVADDDDRWLVD